MSHAQTITQFVLEEFLPDVGMDELDPDYDLLKNGVIDSLGLLKVIAWVEDRFEVSVEDTALDPDNFRSVSAIDAFVDGAAKGAVRG